MRIGVDIDEVLTPFTEEYLPFFNKQHKLRLKPEDFVHYEFDQITGVPLSQCFETCRLWAEQGHTAKLKPYPDALAALRELKAQGHELFIVTGRFAFSHAITKEWIAQHFPGIFSDIFFISFRGHDGDKRSKADVCAEHGMRVLVDDDPHYIEQCRAAGIEIIMPLQHWNKSVRAGKGVHKAREWRQIVGIVSKIEKK